MIETHHHITIIVGRWSQIKASVCAAAGCFLLTVNFFFLFWNIDQFVSSALAQLVHPT